MHFSKSLPVLVVLACLASLAGCAAPAATVRGTDTAVRAEPRRISDATSFPDVIQAATTAPARRVL